MSFNDITGDKIITKPINQAYRNNYGKICWSKLHNPPEGYTEKKYTCPSCSKIIYLDATDRKGL